MAENRPAIGRELEREVRKKCGYACVMCGCPIYDYDHIDDWADVKEHTLENLTLLCTLHHRLKNKGILSKEVIRKRTNNIKHKPNGGLPDINLTDCQLVLGNNIISGWPTIGLLVYERDYFYIDYDKNLNQVVIDAEFFDNNGDTLFKIENNIYTHTHSSDLWDVEARGNSIVIKEGFRKRLLIITIDGINNSITVQGKLFYSDDKYVELTKDGVKLSNDKGEFIIVSENKIFGCDVGLILSDWRKFRPFPCGVSIGEGSKNIIFKTGWYVRTGYGISLDTQDW